jgi:hypothetical protein
MQKLLRAMEPREVEEVQMSAEDQAEAERRLVRLACTCQPCQPHLYCGWQPVSHCRPSFCTEVCKRFFGFMSVGTRWQLVGGESSVPEPPSCAGPRNTAGS